MASDTATVERIRGVLDRMTWLEGEFIGELRMFGGLCFTLDGKMLVGVGKEKIMIRLSATELEQALAEGKATPMDFTGKPLRNFAYLTELGAQNDDQLMEWIARSADYVRTQPAQKTKKR